MQDTLSFILDLTEVDWNCTTLVAIIGGDAPNAMVMYDSNDSFIARDGGNNDEDGVLNGNMSIVELMDAAIYSLRMEIDEHNGTARWQLALEMCSNIDDEDNSRETEESDRAQAKRNSHKHMHPSKSSSTAHTPQHMRG